MAVIYDPLKGTEDVFLTPDDYIISTLVYQGYDNGGSPDGQIVYGGHSAGKNLTLTSTFDGDKGNIYLGTALNSAYDEINDFLGIGTSAPVSTLDVHGAINSPMLNNVTGISTHYQSGVYADARTRSLYIQSYTDGSDNFNAVWQLFGGELGDGYTIASPKFKTWAGYPGFAMGKNEGQGLNFVTYDSDTDWADATPINIMTFDVYGSVGIATTDPLAKLDVQVLENTYQTIDSQLMNIGIRTFGEFDHSATSGNYYTVSAFSTAGTQWNHTDNANDATQLTNYGFDGTMAIGGTAPHRSIGGNFDINITTYNHDGFYWLNEGDYNPLAVAGFFKLGITGDFNGVVQGQLAAAEFGLEFTAENLIVDDTSFVANIAITPPVFPTDPMTTIAFSAPLSGIKIGNQGNIFAPECFGIFIDDQYRTIDDVQYPTFSIYSEGNGVCAFGGLVGIGINEVPNSILQVNYESSTDNRSPSAEVPNKSSLFFTNTSDTEFSGSQILFSSDVGTNNIAAGISFLLHESDTDGSTGELAFFSHLSKTDSDLTEAMRISHEGNVGMGVTDPTSKLTLDGGGTVAPLELRPYTPIVGTNNSIENDGTNLFYTDGTGLQQSVIAGIGGGAKSPQTVPVNNPNNYYGGFMAVLGDPADWLQVVVNGTPRLIPVY